MSSPEGAYTLLYHALVTLAVYFFAKLVYDMATARKQRPKPPVLKQDWKKDVVYLYQFPRPQGSSPNMSPYCVKLEMFLRVNKIKYEMIETIFARSGEGKLPFIELNGEQFSDSQLIIEMLKKRFNIQARFSDDLKPEERAVLRLITRTLDHGTFFNLVYHKLAMNPVSFAGALLKGRAPDFVKYLLAPVFYKQYWELVNAEGTGKHTEQEVIDILRWDLQAVDGILGDKTYLVGDTVTLADCAFFGLMASAYNLPYKQPIQQLLDGEFPRLKAHHDRIAKEFFPDINFGRLN